MIDICNVFKADRKFFIYGTAAIGKFCCEKLCEKYGDDVVIAYIETTLEDRPFDGGKAIITPKEAIQYSDENTCIIVTGRASAEEMKQNCLLAGFKESQIVVAPPELQLYMKTGYSSLIKTVSFWPPVEQYSEDLFQKITFYIPDRISVKLFTKNVDVIKALGTNVDICDELDKQKIWDNSDAILIWNTELEEDLFKKYGDKVRIVDPYYWELLDTTNYLRLYHDSFSASELQQMRNDSLNNFIELQNSAKQYKSANVFCSGPSISEVYDMTKERFTGGFNIICNSMVKDRVLMELLQPRAICIFDTNFFHSPGKYGEAFYRDLREMYRQYGFYVLVRDVQYPLFLKHCPEMKGKIIGVPMKQDKQYWFISQDKFCYRPLANVMTEIMVPLASSLCDKINVAGCTGRSEEENYFWKHNDRTQYLDLKKYVMETWPAFFKYRRYEAYYSKHCQIVEEQLTYGESIGKEYRNITTSYIPAIVKRS